ncbi:MAG: sulfite exporter TauE/SafE family protein [Promethearchaeota archaeon]|nr:MAG: sulfite exporter TauE/SafE family protein [Candidatus Lokiarchaeota archaeon]
MSKLEDEVGKNIECISEWKDEIGREAKLLDEKNLVERLKVERSFIYKFIIALSIFILFIVISFIIGGNSVKIYWEIIILAFLFETMDSSAGMGFGTALSPLLLLLGFTPLQVVPVLLISETITGLTDAIFDHEFGNVKFSFRPLNETTKVTFIIAFFGSFSIFLSIFFAYFAIQFPTMIIKIYTGILVISMGIYTLLLTLLKRIRIEKYNPQRLVIFAAIAGFNKGIGGGGYGPVVTLGEILSGIYEKSATAISSIAEGIVSFIGVLCFFFINYVGIEVDLVLFPSILMGGFFAAILSPYLTRVIPNKIWKIIIPIYSLGLGLYVLIRLFS